MSSKLTNNIIIVTTGESITTLYMCQTVIFPGEEIHLKSKDKLSAAKLFDFPFHYPQT